MRKQTVFFVAAVLFACNSALAAPATDTDPKAPFAKQIAFLLDQNELDPDKGEISAKVLFTFDAQNRIEILEIQSEDEALAAFIQSQLHGRKVYVDEPLSGKKYVLPLRIT